MKVRCCVGFFLLAFSVAHGIELFIAPNGDDQNPGTRENPFFSVEKARDTARDIRGEKIDIVLRGGEYHLDRPLVLTPQDNGTESAPVTWRSAPGERAVLRVAREITEWKPWRNGILVADLGSLGLGDLRFHQLFGKMGKGQTQRLTLARHPNADPRQPLYGGFLYVAEQVEKRSRVQLRYREGDLPLAGWADISQAEMSTVLGLGWMFAQTPIEFFDPENRIIQFRRIRGHMLRLNRYFIQNVLGALDAPGEWFLDYKTGKLYLKPPAAGIGRVFAPLGDRIFDLQGSIPYPHQYLNTKWKLPKKDCPLPENAPPYNPVRHLRFVNLDLECSRQDALCFVGTENCEVIGCRISNVGNIGVNIGGIHSSFPEVGNPRQAPAAGNLIGAGGGGQILLARDPGFGCRVVGCDIWSTGCEGIMLMGEWNLAENNHVYDIGLFAKDAPCINLLGEKNVARRNTLHDCPRCTVFIKGIDNVCEFNENHHANMETTDMGVIRMVQRNAHLRGNVIRYNRISDSIGYGFKWKAAAYYESPFYTWGIYLDDYTCGTTVHGNIVTRCGRGGIMIHGGGDNTITNNFCANAGHFQIELAPIKANYPNWENVFAGNRVERNILLCDRPDAFPYRYTSGTRDFASFANNIADFGERMPVVITRRWDAVCGWEKWLKLGQDRGSLAIASKSALDKNDNPRIAADSPAWELGYKRIPVEKIGCYAAVERCSWPLSPNRDRDREKPILAEIPGTIRPPRDQPLPVVIRIPGVPRKDDFENYPIGAVPAKGADVYAPGKSAIAVSADRAAGGRQSLKFTDAKDLKASWMPRIFYPLLFEKGEVRVLFSLYLADSAATLYIDPRQYTDIKKEYLSGPQLTILPGGILQTKGKTLTTLPLKTWIRFDLLISLDEVKDNSELHLHVAGKEEQQYAIPRMASGFCKLERLVIASEATSESVFFLDDLSIEKEK